LVKWISVKKKLPDLDVSVLLRDDKGRVAIGRYTIVRYPLGSVKEFWIDGICFNFDKRNITHWMPIPEIIKKEDGGND